MKIHLQDTDGTLHEYAVPTIDEVSVGQWMGNAPDTYVLNWNATHEQKPTPT